MVKVPQGERRDLQDLLNKTAKGKDNDVLS
jgi:hypothetical protein